MPEQQTEQSATPTESPASSKAGARPDRASWLREYETIYLLPSDITDEAADKLAERMRELVGKSGGRVIKFITWGRRKTAFDVRHQPRALYVQMSYLGLGKTVSEVERNLRNMEEVEKFITTLVKQLVDPVSRPTEPDVKLSGEIEERPLRPDRSEGLDGSDPDLSDDVIPDLNAVE
jgi:small subunit ribosomal protein S6